MSTVISSGTTVTNRITLPVTQSDLASLYVTYEQRNKTVVEKSLEECQMVGTDLLVPLGQEDTLAFNPKAGKIRIQVRLRKKDGTALKSDIVEAETDEVLKDGVI